MLLTPEQKQKYLAYLEARKNKTEKAPKTDEKSTTEVEPTDLISWCVDSIQTRVSVADEVSENAGLLILTTGLDALGEFIDTSKLTDEFNEVMGENKDENFFGKLGLFLLANPDSSMRFYGGAVAGYKALCEELTLEYDDQCEDIIQDNIYNNFNQFQI
jgi:hypothetical protein